MKRFALAKALALCTVMLVMYSCPTDLPDDEEEDTIPVKYEGFHNYPDGRESSTGTLEIKNSVNSPVLLFTDSVNPANYIGTADSLSTIKVKLPEEKFYTIVAVDRAIWEEKGDKASQFSDLTYYSNTQPYSMRVQVSDTYGGGTWIINNHTNYWVSFRKSDGSGVNYAVAPPNAKRVSVPVQIGTNYDYIPYYYKELKYNGKVIALVESDVLSAADTVTTSEANPTFSTDIGTDITPPSANIKPAVFFTNSSDKTVRVYSSQNNQLSNGAPGVDFALASGVSQLFTNGLEAGVSTNTINFSSIAWTRRVSVSQDISMQINKVYRIVLTKTAADTYATTVEEVDAEEYFD